jgi:hypothetical protein
MFVKDPSRFRDIGSTGLEIGLKELSEGQLLDLRSLRPGNQGAIDITLSEFVRQISQEPCDLLLHCEPRRCAREDTFNDTLMLFRDSLGTFTEPKRFARAIGSLPLNPSMAIGSVGDACHDFRYCLSGFASWRGVGWWNSGTALDEGLDVSDRITLAESNHNAWYLTGLRQGP